METEFLGPRGLGPAGSGGAKCFRFGVRETEEDLIRRDIGTGRTERLGS